MKRSPKKYRPFPWPKAVDQGCKAESPGPDRHWRAEPTPNGNGCILNVSKESRKPPLKQHRGDEIYDSADDDYAEERLQGSAQDRLPHHGSTSSASRRSRLQLDLDLHSRENAIVKQHL